MQTVHLIVDFEAPRERVFGFFSDHQRISEIYPGAFKRIADSTHGSDVNGLGSRRRIILFPLVLREVVTTYRPPEHIEYTLENIPILREHRGIMRFYEIHDGKGTRLDYTIQFESRIPVLGAIIKSSVEKIVGAGVRDLARKVKEGYTL